MELIKPSEISARILSLLDESNERVIIVSPYMKISRWYKLLNRIKELKTRRISMEIYVRDDPENAVTYHDLDQLELDYTKIPNLHSKLYLNERNGIVTSMNLLLSSEINSLEIGYATETLTEFNDLLAFYHRYIYTCEPVQCDKLTGKPTTGMQDIMHSIREDLNKSGRNSWLWLAENALHICTGHNNYRVTIIGGNLKITAALRFASATKPNRIQNTLLIIKKIEDLTSMKVEIHHGHKPDFLQVSAQARQTLQSPWIDGILKAEAIYIIESVSRFIIAIGDPAFQETLINY